MGRRKEEPKPEVTPGEVLARLRAARGLSAYALGNLSGVSQDAILKAERSGAWGMRLDVLHRILAAMEVSPVTFWESLPPADLSRPIEGQQGSRKKNPPTDLDKPTIVG